MLLKETTRFYMLRFRECFVKKQRKTQIKNEHECSIYGLYLSKRWIYSLGRFSNLMRQSCLPYGFVTIGSLTGSASPFEGYPGGYFFLVWVLSEFSASFGRFWRSATRLLKSFGQLDGSRCGARWNRTHCPWHQVWHGLLCCKPLVVHEDSWLRKIMYFWQLPRRNLELLRKNGQSAKLLGTSQIG